MSLVLDDDQILLRDTAAEFARERMPVAMLRRLRDTRDAVGFDASLWREMGELGWTGMLIPEELGGTGFGYLGLGLVLEALGRTLAPTPMLSTVVLAGTALAWSKDTERTRGLLRRIAAAQTVIALALDEGPSHAPYSIATRARRDGDHYVLNGRKRFVIDGHVAEQLIVVARPEGSAGVSWFLVDPTLPGVERQRLTMVDSRNSAHVNFENVRVDSQALLIADGPAAKAVEAVLDRGRILLAAEMLGMAQAAFDTTLAYLKQRIQFGVPIGSFQALKHRAVHMFAEIELARSVVLESLTALDEQRYPEIPTLASLCKARLNDTLMLISNEAAQMHGGMGVTDEIDIGLYLKRARVAQATLGSSAFHRNRFADCQDF